MLTKNEFQKEMEKGLTEAFGEYNCEVFRANLPYDAGTRDALIVRLDQDNPVGPVLYTDPLYEAYQAGKSMEQILKEETDIVREFFNARIEVPELTVENAKQSIRFAVVNAERAEKLLEKCPHIEMEDLAAVPRWIINDEASFAVTNDLVSSMRLTKEEVLDIARKNTDALDFKIRNMNDVLGGMMDQFGVEDGYANEVIPNTYNPLYVVTSDSGQFGAAAMVSDRTLQKIGDTLGENYTILPSSRHEILCIKDSEGFDSEALHQMVYSINRTEVHPDDYLSDTVYHYDRQTHTLTRASEPGVPLYHYDREYAIDHGEIELYRDSLRENIKCRDAIEACIRDGFDGVSIDLTASKAVLQKYGPERTQYVLAATVDNKSWDGRFSERNKAWAGDLRAEYPAADEFAVRSHPYVLDGYIDQVRRSLEPKNEIKMERGGKQWAR